jgi:membrane fusion protein, heavy metal efflux system
VRLLLPIERLKNRVVLPADAVVKEGADSFVFRANGKLLQRIPVQVEHLDARNAVLKQAGALAPGDLIAMNQSYQLNLALKKSQSGERSSHDHAGHSHEH